ncbi:MAG TPA: sugar porter family MFS transporter [Puia sp.]|jgi:SP family arabinose:H+ symporter-like MFS transporter|nr:sugar porter family MFS transporter [Puia sp.]
MRAGTAKTNYICITVAIGGLLFGYDTAVISGAISLIKSQFSLTASMEGWLVSCGLLGCIIGVLVTGFLSDRAGRKKTILLAGFLFLYSGLGCAFSTSFNLLIISRLAGGIGVGMASVVAPMYIAEFAPADKRGKMIAWYQLAITIGILLAYFSNAMLLFFAQGNFEDPAVQWFFKSETWRPMFLMMSVPALIFMLMLIPVPESPRWLVSVNKKEKARQILNTVRPQLLAIKELGDMENAAQKAAVRKRSVLDPSLRLPLIIGIVLAVLQQFSGINAIIYYGPGIFESAGINSSNALVFQVIIGAVNLLFTLVAIRWADQYGRKRLLKAGLAGIIVSLAGCGILFYTGHAQGILLLILMLLFIACFAFSLGPVTWIIINEIFPTEVRVKAVSICVLALWIAVWLVGQFFPWLLEKSGAAFTFWMFAGFSIINFIFCWKVVKETTGKTLEEMEQVFLPAH